MPLLRVPTYPPFRRVSYCLSSASISAFSASSNKPFASASFFISRRRSSSEGVCTSLAIPAVGSLYTYGLASYAMSCSLVKSMPLFRCAQPMATERGPPIAVARCANFNGPDGFSDVWERRHIFLPKAFDISVPLLRFPLFRHH